MKTSPLELKFDMVWRALNGPAMVSQFRFHATRCWRFDFAHPATFTAIEIQGGTWTRGGHARGAGIRRDYEKLNHAMLAGWTVFLLTGDMITVDWLRRIIDFIRELSE